MTLTTDKTQRKNTPMFSGLLAYFPDALAEVARVSEAGSRQHHPGEPLHWDKSKSTDHADCIVRHLVDSGTLDDDGMRHSAKVAWRSLALLQTEIDKEKENQEVKVVIESLPKVKTVLIGGMDPETRLIDNYAIEVKPVVKGDPLPDWFFE